MSIVIRGGAIPAGDRLVAADVLVHGDRIGAVGEGLAGDVVVDAGGAIVLPGFVDAHVHGELALLEEPIHEQALRQGVTSYVVGQDGTSIVPGSPAMRRYFAAVNGDPDLDVPAGVAGLLGAYDGANVVNAAYLVPNGNLRHDAVGLERRPATARELDAMCAALDAALREGAVGLSSGLDYVPSGYADASELSALCEVVARHGKVYVTHMRGYGAKVELGMQEVCEIARRSGVRVHISHFSGPAHQVLPHVDAALDAGMDLTFDTYPYTAGSSVLHMYLLPAEAQAGGPETVLERLDGLAGDVAAREADTAGRIVVASAPAEGWRWAEGLTLGAVAERAGLSFAQAVLGLLRDTGLRVSVVEHRRTFGPEDIAAVRRHPAHMTGSDGIFLGSSPHPRGWGTFATLLRDHLDGRTGWTWDGLVDHLAGSAARRFGLKGRGTLEPGAFADLAVVDPATVRAAATYEHPRAPAAGMRAVLVNGEPALLDGEPTGARPGRGLRA